MFFVFTKNCTRWCLGILGASMRFLMIILLLASRVSYAEGADTREYPSQWWKTVAQSDAKSWEVLPQEANPGEVILSKRTELGILSNFAATPIDIDGKKYASLEAFWQMMKYPENSEDERRKFKGIQWPFTREQVSKMLGFEAKHAGNLAGDNMKKMKINWITYQGKKLPYRVQEKGLHYQLIRRAMQAKLEQNSEVKRVLKATGGLILKPDHDQGKNVPPAWKYHEIWMEIRAKLSS
jgi:predicted NAD-dependent protein-ADP-ribosyltransferase YbiA (DUF1768 family)